MKSSFPNIPSCNFESFKFNSGSEREVNYGESLIVLLKMFATLRSYFSAKGIDTIEFKDTFSEVMKELITDRIQDPAMELRNNQGLAEYLLEYVQ